MKEELTDTERKQAAAEFAGALRPYIQYGPGQPFKTLGEVADYRRSRSAVLADGGSAEEERLP